MTAVITFEPLGVSIPCTEGESLFEAARRHDIPIPTACVGRGTCGLCRVKILAGAVALSPLNSTEKRHLGNNYFITGLRLSCQTRLTQGEAATDIRLQIPDAMNRRQGQGLPGPGPASESRGQAGWQKKGSSR